MTDGDRKIFEAAQRDVSIFTSFYLGKTMLDWQAAVHHGLQPDQVIVGGWGSGKSRGIALSALAWCAMVPHFKFYCIGPEGRQAYDMFYDIRNLLGDNTPYYQRFIEPALKGRWGARMVEKPYPQIVVCYGIPTPGREVRVRSEMHFMSGKDDARYIKNVEGDWVVLEQAELVDNLDEMVRNIGSRTRGERVDGTSRLGRLTLLANSADNPELWARFDMAELYPDDYLSIITSAYGNPHLTAEQVRSLERRSGGSREEIDQHLRGVRPLGRGTFFPPDVIRRCTNSGLDEIMERALAEGLPGFVVEKSDEAGIVTWQMPPDHEGGRVYLLLGDPGSGNPPERNAPCLMVWDIAEFPKRAASLRAFWWGFGNGAITPFLSKYALWQQMYKAELRSGYDSTGMQKMLNELAFGVEGQEAVGIDFSGLKTLMLRAAQLLFEKGLFEIPSRIRGIGWQLSRYDLPDDRKPQDIVATIMMTAWWLSQQFGWEIEPPQKEEERRQKAQTAPVRGQRPLPTRFPMVRIGR